MSLPQILLTKISPPRQSPRTLPRQRVSQALSEAFNHRVTLLVAGAGYGKSTALSEWVQSHSPTLWYQAGEEDTDAVTFLLHLCHATERALPGVPNLPLAWLESWDGTRGPVPVFDALDQYLNAIGQYLANNSPGDRVLLVIDDAHLSAAIPEIAQVVDRLVGRAPSGLHLLLAARPPLKLPSLPRWRARGEVLTVSQLTLAFNPAEIGELFTQVFGYEVSQEEVESLYAATEGWAAALHLIWQSLRSGAVVSVDEAISRQGASLESLFSILAEDVLGRQPEDVQEFLKRSATLLNLDPEACAALGPVASPSPGGIAPIRPAAAVTAAEMLAYLRREELFVVENAATQTLRYQSVFQEFLRQRAAREECIGWHKQAASYYQGKSNPDAAIYHLLQAGDHASAAEQLVQHGAALLSAGRLDTLAAYLDTLPPLILAGYPILLTYLGDLARLHSRFQEALGWYQQAEALWRERGQLEGVARALRGQVRIYLDTVNPSRAEELLQASLRISDGISDRESQARLFELLAENKLNAGKVQEADQLRRQAESLRLEGPSDTQLTMRVLLRTGRLAEARQRLEAQAEQERRQPIQTPRAHRETQLLLSIIYAFQGEARLAYEAALEGTRRGQALHSPFVTAVGHIRQGHALLLLPQTSGPHAPARPAEARQQFEKALELSQAIAIQRLRVEACWGLSRAYGYPALSAGGEVVPGDLNKALQMAQEAIAIASLAGDEWIASISRLTMGAAFVLAGRSETAVSWLEQAARGFQECSDPFGLSVSRLWLCLDLVNPASRVSGRERPGLLKLLAETLAVCSQQEYDFLFTRPTCLGPPDERLWVPMLVLARDEGLEPAFVDRVLHQLGLSGISQHPGYQLRVQTLGSFQVWLGPRPVPAGGWRREKARQLFQLLLTFRDSALEREQFCEYLWPEADPSAAQRNFKVSLNALFQVLDPNRPPGTESTFVRREGSMYSLRLHSDMVVDAAAFTQACQDAEKAQRQSPGQPLNNAGIAACERAVALYQGEYLPEARYDTWAAAERERLAVLFLQTADLLCETYLAQKRYDEVIHLSQRILSFDNCWERAYRHLMQAYAALGDFGQAARAYQRCRKILQEELDVAPAPETQALYKQLTQLER